MEGFEEKLHFYFPEEPAKEEEEEDLPERHEPLPEWATFFLRIGLKLAEKRADNNDLESLVLSVPCRDLAASLITFGLIKGRSTVLNETDNDEHFRMLRNLPLGTALYFIEKNIKKPAMHVGYDQKTDAIQVRTTIGTAKTGSITRHFYKEGCDKLQLSGQEVPLPIGTERKGGRLVAHRGFLEAVLEKTDINAFTSDLEPEAVILGSKNLLLEEMTKEQFSFAGKNITGSLDDLIRFRSGSFRGSNFGAFIAPRDGEGSKRLARLVDLKSAPFVIFDSPKSFLYWRRSWQDSNWIIILNRTETAYQEAVISINEQVARNEQSRLMDEIARLGIPSGIELISFSRKRWN